MKNVGDRFNPYKLFNGLYVPEPIAELSNKKLSQGAKLAYGRLCRYSGKNGVVHPKIATLAKEIGCEERQAANYLKELKEFRLIQSKRIGCGKANKYYFIWHEILIGRERNSSSNLEDNTALDMSDSSSPYIKESHVKDSHLKENTAGADILSFDEIGIQVNEIVERYRNKINKNVALDSKAEILIRDAIKHFPASKLIEAIDNFSHNDWYMRHQRYNPLGWFFKDVSTIYKWLELECDRHSVTIVA